MKKLLELNNEFHNTSVTLRVSHDGGPKPGDIVVLSARQARKARKALCCKDCICSGVTGARAMWHTLGNDEIGFHAQEERDDITGKLEEVNLHISRVF